MTLIVILLGTFAITITSVVMAKLNGKKQLHKVAKLVGVGSASSLCLMTAAFSLHSILILSLAATMAVATFVGYKQTE